MTQQELRSLRSDFILKKNDYLQQLYQLYKADCIGFLKAKNYCDEPIAEGHFTEALIIFRNNVIQGKLTELSNMKSYLIGICINLVRADKYQEEKKIKKVDSVRLLLYNNDHNVIEEDDKEEMMQRCLFALSQVSERCQTILKAFYVHKLSMNEIAEELGLSSKDVAKTLKMRCYKSWIEAAKIK